MAAVILHFYTVSRPLPSEAGAEDARGLVQDHDAVLPLVCKKKKAHYTFSPKKDDF